MRGTQLKNRIVTALAALMAFSSVSLAMPARAAELRIGLAADVSSLDPHYLNIAPNIALATHLFDTLVAVNPDGQLVPGLAASWRVVDPTTWEFKLRPGVKFHDGSALTAEDVLFSLDRPAALVGSPGPFTSYTRQIVAKEAPDPLTVRLKTAAPYGPLPLDLSSIFIVSKKAALHASTADFNSGKAAIGSGPLRLVRFLRGDRIELARNENYWGDRPAWDKVTLRILTSNAPRLAALLAGDVDAIEGVPAAHIGRIRSDAQFSLAQKVSWRTLFWHLDQSARPSPFVTDKAGKPLPQNPLRDARVRRAMSMAIDREALTSRTMEGLAVPAANLVAPGIFGHDPALPVEKYDPDGARKLLAEAGYPDGFALTLHGTNDRYINDAAVVQTTAQFLNRVGIRAQVQTMPLSIYFGRARKGEFSAALLGWGSLAGDFALRTVVGTPNPQTGWGSWNWGKYSNSKVDALVQSALSSVAQTEREQAARQAAALALGEYAIVPMHHQVATWAMRKGLQYTARTDEFTFAHLFHPQ